MAGAVGQDRAGPEVSPVPLVPQSPYNTITAHSGAVGDILSLRLRSQFNVNRSSNALPSALLTHSPRGPPPLLSGYDPLSPPPLTDPRGPRRQRSNHHTLMLVLFPV